MAPKFTRQQQARIDAAKTSKAALAQEEFNVSQQQPLLSTTQTPLIAEGSAVDLPTDQFSPIGIEDEPRVAPAEGVAETSSTLLQQGMEEETGLQPLQKKISEIGLFSEEENDYIFGRNVEERKQVAEAVQEDLTTQAQRGTLSTPALYETKTAEEFKETLGPETDISNDAVDNVIGQGVIFNNDLNRMIRPMLASSSPEALKLQNFIVSNNLWDGNAQKITDNVGQGLSVSFLEIARDIYDKTDDSVEVKATGLSADAVDPNTIRERITESLIDKLIANPNVGPQENVRTDFGGAGALVDPEVKSMLDVIAYKTFAESNLFDVRDLNENDDTTTIVDQVVALSPEGHAFLETGRDVLNAIHPDRRVNVSYAPPVVEGLPGRERELGNKARAISKRNKSSKNTVFEDAVKLKLSSIPLRIDKDGFTYAAMMVASEIQINPQGFIIFLNQSPTGNAFSVGKYAKILGISEAHWLETRETALKRYGENNKAKANEQANKVMRMKARKALQTIQDGANNIDKVFYNKFMHASSVGRFFIRNTVLNTQTDKGLSRGMVVGAKKLILNVNNDLKGENKRTFDNWKYIIGKNLLDPDTANAYSPTGGLRTEDMTWSSIQRLASRIIDNENDPIYKEWVRRGNALKEALASNDFAKLEAATAGVHSKDFTKSGEWGYKLQSYIDFANYDAAKKGSGNFEMRATTQHDGKQNGIAIQAMQTGSLAMLKLVGMFYNPNADSVIPQGDIRDMFLNKAIENIDTAFASNLDKKAFWLDLLKTIKKERSPEKKADLIKALSKTPLMESSYGMPIQYHMETALEFMDKDGQELIEKVIARHSAINEDRINNKEFRNEMASDLNNIIGVGLTATLNLAQQKLYKDAGKIWAMLGVTPEMLGPLGTDIYMGTNEHFKTGRTIEVENIDGTTSILELTESRSTGSAGKKTRNRVYDKDLKKYVTMERSRFGQLVANQLPVLTVQQIDAAIMAKTIDAVNRNFDKRKGQAFEPVKFVLPVHDAIITNAQGVDVYHREINNQFKKVNMDYSISQSIYQGLAKAMNKMKERSIKNPNKRVDVDYEGRYRAVHDKLVLIEDKINKQAGVYTEMTGLQANLEDIGAVSSVERAQLKKAKAEGWTRDGGQLRLATLYEIISDFEKKQNVIGLLKQRHAAQEAAKLEIYKQLVDRPYQYN